ncbi:hypothetical protein [Flavobacterium sp. 140616W15]|uniref:hypothetical protein n=1 Tax=Flavobacterium sp. 140616W15 TaxID=2478552 RepID=UPI000F0D112A|nr:hypothetical protein [Flavobacterium sp. 140616W15]AYN03804.1 hypothetical protein EAG11_06125 [Flavobacterium sp. 140616W15]
MIKKLLTVLNLLAFIAVFGQSGIGTHTPEGALDITSPSKDWGLVLPHVDQAENTKNPTGKAVKKGTIVYDLKENCIRYFNGTEWSGCILAPIPSLLELNCSAVVVNQDIIANYPIGGGTTVSIPYSNAGEAFDYGEIAILSKNIIGLKAVLPSGSIQKGSGSLVFSIIGTPSTSGEAKFYLNIGGVDCEFVVIAKNYTDTEVPIADLTCGLNEQLNITTLKGEHIINGKEVTVTYDGSNIKSIYESDYNCSAAVVANGFWLGYGGPSTLVIRFSRPVTNVGIAFKGTQTEEEFTFTINNNHSIQLKTNSSCQEKINITDNRISFIGGIGAIGGNITVGGKWFTELTIKHNGQINGSVFGFCLNNSDAL